MTAIEIKKEYTIERYKGYEEILDIVVTKITKIEHFKHHTGCSFVNDTFEIHPYYFGQCLCSYKKKYESFLSNNPHKADCFLIELSLLNDAFRKHPKYFNNNKLKAERANEERKLCIAHKVDYKDGKNLDEFCNCGADEKFNIFNYQHEEGCPKIVPNFWYKNLENPLKIYWYKTYFRDATCSRKINKNEFNDIINCCLRSL